MKNQQLARLFSVLPHLDLRMALAILLLIFTQVFLLAGRSSAASLGVDEGSVRSAIGGQALGTLGPLILDPPGVLGWANYSEASLVPKVGESGGSINITAEKIGNFTLGVITDNRFRQSWTGGSDTIGFRAALMGAGDGFRFSFVPGAVGSYTLMIHITDYNVDVNYAVTQGGNPVGSGSLSAFDVPSTYDEGPVYFTFTVDDATEAAATWNFDVTRAATGGADALLIGAVSLVGPPPPPLPPPPFSLGKILCIGDSITEGRATRPAGEGNWSWRPWFWENLIDFSVGHEFVGTRTANYEGVSTYPLYEGVAFNNRHEAIWGTSMLDRSNQASAYLGTLKSTGKSPDTAIIFGGGNDIPINLSVSAATVRDRFKVLVDHLQGDLGTAGNPNIRILLVSILPRFNGGNLNTPDVRNSRFQDVNSLLAALATAETTSTSEVLYLNLWSLFDPPSGKLYDGIHPNGMGEQLIGNAVFAALVPDLPAVQLAITSVNETDRQVNFMVRTHGPRLFRIETSQDLSPASWSTRIPAQLNPGEWMPMTIVETPTFPSRNFYRAVAE